MNKLLPLVAAMVFTAFLSGCTAVRLVDAAASTAVSAGKLAVKGTAAAVGAAIPDKEEEKKKKK